MPIAQRDQRSNVLKAGSKGGWTHDQGLFDGNDLIRDLFESERGQVRAIWVRTPWSDSGRYAGAIFYDAQAGKERNLWKVTGAGGLLDLLAGS